MVKSRKQLVVFFVIYIGNHGTSQKSMKMTPRDIYDRLGMEAVTGEDLKNPRVERLVTNNLKSHYITLNGSTGRVKMTDPDNYCYSNCGGAPTPD
ncbi:MAG: hypothetical protein WAM14_05260 [Candidatus Nitrosopolaris sp.]